MSKRILLGFGNNIDYEIHVNAKDLERLIRMHSISVEEIQKNVKIRSERTLVISILTFLSESKGGECWIEQGCDMIETFANRFEKKITIGGNAARAGIVMDKLGLCPMIHLVHTNAVIRELLPKGCAYICDSENENIYPHLIIQFDAGMEIHENHIDIITQHSDRIIYVDDEANAQLRIAPQTLKIARDVDVLMVSGINSIRERSVLKERLDLVKRMIATMPEGADVFYEESCLTASPYYSDIMEQLKGRITIYSLNEDELQQSLGQKESVLDESYIATALKELQSKVDAKIIVLHTKWYALAYGRRAGDYRAALRAGVDVAGTRYRLGDAYTVEDVEETSGMPLYKEGSMFAEKISNHLEEAVCCIPSHEFHVNKAVTIGLGDSFVGGFLSRIP